MVISAQQAVPARTFPWCLRPGSRRAFSPSAKLPRAPYPPSHRPPSFRDLASQGLRQNLGEAGGWGRITGWGVFLVKGERYTE